MSIVPIIASTAAITAAAARKKRLEKEEEDMTRYNGENMEKWEFKIIRSATGKFKNYDVVRQLCQEESRFGWEMMEKFDNNRIRFKRPIEKRANDQYQQGDPYRTSYGMGEGALVAMILGTIGLATGLVLLIVYLIKSGF